MPFVAIGWTTQDSARQTVEIPQIPWYFGGHGGTSPTGHCYLTGYREGLVMPLQGFSDNRDVGNLALPQTGQIDYWDRLLPSFGVRVSSGGNKSFVVSTRV